MTRTMTQKRLIRHIRQKLESRRAALRRSLSGELSQFNTSDDRIVGDAADAAVDSDYGFVNSQLAEAESRELASVEEALDRIHRGTYGVCVICGRNIAAARLQALPYATTCIRCQRNAEHRDATGSTWSDRARVEDLTHQPRKRSAGSLNVVA